MKLRTVIFSSIESLSIARAFSKAMNSNDFDTNALHITENTADLKQYDGIECRTWMDLPFELSSYARIDLERFGKEYDFALFIFGYEDCAQIHRKTAETDGKLLVEDCRVTRDNVVFELGLISGIIGAERCIIIDCFHAIDQNHGEKQRERHLPSDIKGVNNVPFNTDPAKRADIIYDRLTQQIVPHMIKIGKTKHIDPDLMSQIHLFGLSALYSNRNDLQRRKSDDGRQLIQLKDYLGIARHSIKLVAFSLAQGVIYGEVGRVLKEKIEGSADFTVMISLLNPFDPIYYTSCYVSLDREDPEVLMGEAKASIKVLQKFKDQLRAESRARFIIKLHNTAKFEAAVLIDDDESDGRIQVEIKPYRVNVFDAYSFEIRKNDSPSLFYNLLKRSYDDLLDQAIRLDDSISVR